MSTTHTPPAAARANLGAIESLLRHRDAQPQNDQLHGAEFICKLPGGALYFESALELDTDGSVYAQQDNTGNRAGETSAHYRDGLPLDADATNYIVLPKGGFAARVGIKLGDIAMVIYRDRLAYACLGDFGPDTKLGEGSIALHRALGFERVVNGRLDNNGIDGGVVTIVFPNSGAEDSTSPEHNRVGVLNIESSVRGILFAQRLIQTGEQFEQAELARLRGPRQLTIPDDPQALLRLLRPWVEEVVAATPHPRTIEGRKPVDYLMARLDGLDVLLYSPTAMAGGRQPPRPVKNVYAQFDTDTDDDGRWYVRGITFHLDPRAQAAAEQALAVGG